MRIGYARVSSQDQDNTAQIAALNAAGCGRIFEEKVSAGRWNRPELSRLLDHLRKDDVLVVWKLDRLSRSLKDVLTLMDRVEKTGAGFLSLTEAVDTTSPAGRMRMQLWDRLPSSNAPCCKSAPTVACWPPVKKVVSAVAVPSSRPRNKRKLPTWSILARKRPPNRRACSMSIRLRWRDCWHATNLQIS